MAGYIKSHSNYRLQTRHQVTNNGVIYERDISTVGGVNSFATGQSTIYQSGNFVILINKSKSASRHIKKKEWLASGYNDDTWDITRLSGHSSDINGSLGNNITIKNDFLDFRSFAYYGSLSDLVENTVTSIISTFPYELYKTDNVISAGTFVYDSLSGLNPTILTGKTYYEVSNPGSVDIYNTVPGKVTDTKELGHFYNNSYQNYAIYYSTDDDSSSGVSFDWNVSPIEDAYCPKPWIIFSKITLSGNPETNISYKIYAYWNDRLEIKYITDDTSNFHIRPKMDKPYYDEFVNGLDLFGKCLIGEYSGEKNTAKFEVFEETDNGVVRVVKSFRFPTSEGGYNLGSDSFAMMKYISELGGIALRYDNYYTDNLYRMMTHDSIKNLDWTRNFNGTSDEYENEYTKNGEKISSVIRIIGHEFDKEKIYIDSIGTTNSITYSNRDNLSDYFLTDSLETDGWVINSIYPYELTEYSGGTEDITENDGIWTKIIQSSNTIDRKFSEITTMSIKPYEYFDTPYYTACDGGVFKNIDIGNYEGETYHVESGNVYNVITNYSSNKQYTLHDINNEFMRRLKINSRYLLKKKGTIEGIESLLSLFGLKSRRWAEKTGTKKIDYDINEYVVFASPIEDTYDTSKNEWKYNWYNKCKTISYAVQGQSDVGYIDYQGLPVAYREITNGDVINRKLYPFFESSGMYDGNMYYQMNGGWVGYIPYRFDTEEKILLQPQDNLARVETMRNVMVVDNIQELISQPSGDLFDGIVYYVTDISDKYALINGHPYKLKEEIYTTYEMIGENMVQSSTTEYYFECDIYGGAITFGDTMFMGNVIVSNKRGSFKQYDLNLYKNGSYLKIYYTGKDDVAFLVLDADVDGVTTDVNINEYSENEENTAYIFMNGEYYNSDDENSTSHYFKLSDINNSDKIGPGAWEKIKTSSEEYRKINSIIDKTEGNNPHSGNYNYDNGREYIERFNHLFKYASENRLFNEICFPDVEEAYEDIDNFGFSTKEYTDRKIHSFTDTFNSVGTLTEYNIDEITSLSGLDFYVSVAFNHEVYDGVTSQIINTKRFDITFYLNKNDAFLKESEEQIKYIQTKIMPYVEQMIPSTSIVNIVYKGCEFLNYLTFEALEDNTTFTFTRNSLQYSLDNGTTWEELSANTPSPIVNSGNKILWKQTGLVPVTGTASGGIGIFSSTGNFNVSGNIMSLYYGDEFIGKTDLTGKNYAFLKMFQGCNKLVNAKNLILPATILSNYCYNNMFYGCISLVTAPELPATTLADNCYSNMFGGCTSLTTVPNVLPATTLANNCYTEMFQGCRLLTTAPKLPATTLASWCYGYMFYGCTSLVNAPELPATTLTSNCYSYMFWDCTSLETAPELPATTLAGYCYTQMFQGCTSLVTAPELPATTLANSCYRNMFQGCTSLSTAPELPATTLADGCYGEMFLGCTSLTTAPELPATTLDDKCYGEMFRGCTSLTIAPELPATTLTIGCYMSMFSGCTSLNYIKCLATDIRALNCTGDWVALVPRSGTFVKADGMEDWTISINGIPRGWTIENA